MEPTEKFIMPPKHDVVEKKHVLCMVGIEKYYVEKDVIKFLRKHMEKSSARPLPLTSVHKRRGNSFVFLNFKDFEEM